MPKILGPLIAIAALSYLIYSFALLLAPPFAAAIFPGVLMPAFVGELSLTLWLLYGGVHARQIIGWPTAESRMYLTGLLEHATKRQFVYVHEWQVGDLVIWDNRSTLHRGRRFDIAERRELRRTTVNDTPEAMLMAAG